MELEINCVPSELITREVCSCLFVRVSVHVWTLRGLVNHKSILVWERSNTERIITVISVSDGKSDGDQDMMGPSG